MIHTQHTHGLWRTSSEASLPRPSPYGSGNITSGYLASVLRTSAKICDLRSQTSDTRQNVVRNREQRAKGV
jgi:hypothetical protein